MKWSITPMRNVPVFLFLLAILPGIACGKNCDKMMRDLEQLRKDYHHYATSAPAEGMPITFDGLVAILDKIIAVKRDIETSCKKIPPRRKVYGEKR